MPTALVIYAVVTNGSWDPRKEYPVFGASRFFWAQANAMVHGRLSVPNDMLLGECYLVDGRCFGYYGLTPSLLRIPLLPVMHATGSGLASVSIVAALGLAFWAALDLVHRVIARAGWTPGPWLSIAVAVQLGVGSVVMFAAMPMVYQEAAAWSIGWGLLLLDLAFRRCTGDGWAPWWALVATGVLAANARPTLAVICFALGAIMCVRLLRSSDGPRRFLGPVLLGTLPLLTVVGVWFAKFGEPVPDLRLNEQVPESPVWAEVLDRNGDRTEGLVFVPTTVTAYFRPDSVDITRDAPFVEFGFRGGDVPAVWPLAAGGAYTEQLVSVTDVMPGALAAGALGSLSLARRARRTTSTGTITADQRILLWLGAAAATGPLLTLTNASITMRYLPDFYPALVLAVAIGVAAAPATLWGRWPMRVALVVTSAWSTWIALGLAWRLNSRLP